MNIHFLGTGSAEPDPARANTSLLLGFDDRCVLVDCSGSPGHAIQSAGFSLESLSDVVLTHSHTDHLYALPSLIHGLWMHGGVKAGKSLTIHATRDVGCVARVLLEAFDLITRKDAVVLTWKDLPATEPGLIEVDIPRWTIRSFPVTHGTIQAVGLGLDHDDGSRIVYSADAIVDHLLMAQLHPQPAVWIQDCGGGSRDTPGHAGAPSVAQLVANSGIETLMLVHLPPSPADDVATVRTIIESQFPGELVIPNDGDVFQVKT